MEQDFKRAFELYKLAADQGDPVGQVNLAEMCEAGRGVAQDLAHAKELFKRAAAAGDAEAERKFAELSARGRAV